jgi:hypothetical protein
MGLGAATESTTPESGGSTQQQPAGSTDSEAKPAAKKSNDEFRKMFLQGKNL